MNTLIIHPQEAVADGGSIRKSAKLELSGMPTEELFYLFPSEQSSRITSSTDPFLIASILMGMRNEANIQLRGTVSPSLIRNLYEFQEAWHAWRPEKYRKIDISAEREQEESYERTESKAVCAFTGGIDST